MQLTSEINGEYFVTSKFNNLNESDVMSCINDTTKLCYVSCTFTYKYVNQNFSSIIGVGVSTSKRYLE